METSYKTNSKSITALFKNPKDAEAVYKLLRERGYTPQEISVLMSEETRNQHFKHTHSVIEEDTDDHAMEKGSVIGGVLGAVVGAAVAIAVPGIGLIAAGPIAAGIAGAGVGGVTGGALGALAGAGVSDDFKEEYEKGIKDGGVVIGTKLKNEHADDVKVEWENKGQYINFNQ